MDKKVLWTIAGLFGGPCLIAFLLMMMAPGQSSDFVITPAGSVLERYPLIYYIGAGLVGILFGFVGILVYRVLHGVISCNRPQTPYPGGNPPRSRQWPPRY